MKKLDRFVLSSFIGPFAAILLVVVFVLILQFLWLYIDELVGKGLGVKVILEFMLWGACTTLPIALPLATLLSSMMVVGNLGENNELMAIKAAGVSLARVLMPLMLASAVIAVGAFYVGDRLVPKAYNEIFTLREDISRTKDEIKIPSGIFYDGIEGYVLRVNENDDETGMMHGVMVYDHTGNKGNTSLSMADSATLKMSPNKDFLIFTLYNGANYQETNTKNYRDTTLELQRINFARQELIIPLKNYTFEKSDSARFGDQIMSMNSDQLRVEKDSLDKVVVKQQNRHYRMLVGGPTFVEKSQLDTASRNGISRNFEWPGFMDWGGLSDEVSAYQKASESADRMHMDVLSYAGDVYDTYWYKRRADLELLRKLGRALACFMLFFIGAPLGALIRKGGLGASAIIAVLFFLLYYVVDLSGAKLAKDGTIDAFNGAYVAMYVMVPICVFLTWKAMNDSSLGLDGVKTWARRLWSRIRGIFHKPRIVYMGTPEFAVAPLDRLISSGYKVVGAVTVADKPSGRGLSVSESAVKQYCTAHGIPVLQPLKLRDPGFLSELAAFKADLFVVVAFRMLPEEVWRMPKLGTINLHAALLPQYRGAAPINWAVINGEKMSGVTTFMIDKDIDTGGIILREEVRIAPDETAGELHDKLMEVGSELVVQTVEGLIQNNVETRVQRSFIQGGEVLKAAPKLTRELARIDWNDSTSSIYNLIRGLSPYPAAFTELTNGEKPVQMKIYSAEKRYDLHGAPGTVFSDGRTYLAIATADGAVGVKDIQAAGKKRMEVKAFLAGFREPGSYRALEGTSKSELERARSL